MVRRHSPTHERQYSEETAREIDCAVRELTDHAREQALHILTVFRQELEDSAVQLLEKETLRAEDLPRLDLRKLTATSKDVRSTAPVETPSRPE